MKEWNLSLRFRLFSYDELSEDDRRLIDAARQATYRSYAPYSRFSVGAAARLATVPRASMDTAALRAGLGLTDAQEPMLNLPVGHFAR